MSSAWHAPSSEPEFDSGSEILLAYDCIRRVCAFARLSPVDADDVSQEVWLWLLRNRHYFEAGQAHWLTAVARNFIRRYRRARTVRTSRERRALREPNARGKSFGVSIERRIYLNEIETRLPRLDADLLGLLREGFSFGQAMARLGIPRGSHNFVRKRLLSRLTPLTHRVDSSDSRPGPRARLNRPTLALRRVAGSSGAPSGR